MSSIYINEEVFKGRPVGKRIDKEERVYNYLEEINIPFKRIDHEPTATVEDCEKVEKILDIKICKNLFICNKQKTEFYMLMMRGNKSYKAGDISRQVGSSRLSFANAEDMEKFLDITPGSVSVLGLINDKEHKVKLLIDLDLLNDEYLGCHPCINTSSLKIKFKDILDKFLPSLRCEPIFVEVKLFR